MFDPSPDPRLFGIPPGLDFPALLVQGVRARMSGSAPEDMGRVEIWVNTKRMQRRLRSLFAEHVGLLPRVRVLADLAHEVATFEPTVPASSLGRQLDLVTLVRQLRARALIADGAGGVFDVATALDALLQEMDAEGVATGDLIGLDVADESGHWQNSVAILSAVAEFLGHDGTSASAEAHRRQIILGLIEHWRVRPPDHPVLLAGSTGSRRSTADLMEAIARLPQGAVILPGFDFDLTDAMWRSLADPLEGQSHPQYRFLKLMDRLGLDAQNIANWAETETDFAPRRKLISLSLCPAPVTDYWLSAAADFVDTGPATDNVALLEAPSPRVEAAAIALRIRDAVERGFSTALISPDRTLARRVSAALDRWAIVPDDSAGRPLPLTPPGRLLSMLRDATGQMSRETLLSLLKHPLVHSGGARGQHLLWVQELELSLRRGGPNFLAPADLAAWAPDDDAKTWASWVSETLLTTPVPRTSTLGSYLDRLIYTAEMLCAGCGQSGAGGLWEEAAGRSAKACLAELRAESHRVGDVSHADFVSILQGSLGSIEVRDQAEPHSLVKIWGTLEARVQGTDVVILAGLNEGTWPSAPKADPWLNRRLRHQAGLLLPDREIGLAAHDYQQAVCAPTVWLTRSERSDDAQTVPARWVNRLTNLVSGLQDGEAALAAMRARASDYLSWAMRLDTPGTEDIAPRPSPVPPVAARPKSLSVTQVRTLIRDPYAIYARHILKLRKLDPLRLEASAALRGEVSHKILEQFTLMGRIEGLSAGIETLLRQAELVLEANVPWPTQRRIWLGRMARVAEDFVQGEMSRQQIQNLVGTETSGQVQVPVGGFTLTAKADRVDAKPDGTVVIYDYKTGSAPSEKQQLAFDKQLLLSAAMVERGAFPDIGARRVSEAHFIQLKPAEIRQIRAPLEHEDAWAKFISLIASYFDPEQGYTARRAMERDDDRSDYDGISRFGEWDATAMPKKIEVG